MKKYLIFIILLFYGCNVRFYNPFEGEVFIEIPVLVSPTKTIVFNTPTNISTFTDTNSAIDTNTMTPTNTPTDTPTNTFTATSSDKNTDTNTDMDTPTDMNTPIPPPGWSWIKPAGYYDACDILSLDNLYDGTDSVWHHWVTHEHWVSLDLGQSYNIDKLRMWRRQPWDVEYAIQSIQVSEDPEVWIGPSVGSKPRMDGNEPQGWYEAEMINSTGRYVMLVSEMSNTPYWREIEFYVED